MGIIARLLRTPLALLVFKTLLSLFTGLLMVQSFSSAVRTERWLFCTLFGASVASIHFRWGYFVPFTILGTIWANLADNCVKGGTAQSQLWESICNYTLGVGLGCLEGIHFDRTKVEANVSDPAP
jgi:hypothetical protein